MIAITIIALLCIIFAVAQELLILRKNKEIILYKKRIETINDENEMLNNINFLLKNQNKMLKKNNESSIDVIKKQNELLKILPDPEDFVKIKTILNNTRDALFCYQEIISKKEVQYALITSDNQEKTLKQLEILKEKMERVKNDLLDFNPEEKRKKNIQFAEKKEKELNDLFMKENGRRPANAYSEEKKDKEKENTEISFESMYAKLKKETLSLPDKINNYENFVMYVNILITLKQLDNPLITYDESDESLKDIKRMIEKFTFMIEEAKKENPAWNQAKIK
jgi:hypothetical protein